MYLVFKQMNRNCLYFKILVCFANRTYDYSLFNGKELFRCNVHTHIYKGHKIIFFNKKQNEFFPKY